MKSLKLLFLASSAIFAVCPATCITISMGNSNKASLDVGWWNIMIRNSSGRTSISNGELACDKCTALIELTKGSLKKIIECTQGSCTQTEYNTLTGEQIVPVAPLNIPEIPQKSPIFGFFDSHPILAPVMVGSAAIATGYGLYKLSQWLQKPKKQ